MIGTSLSSSPAHVHRPRSHRALALAALAFAYVACGSPPSATPPPTEAAVLEDAFTGASERFRIPSPLLEAVGWQASRWHQPDESVVDGHFGLMQLPEETLASAATLTGHDEHRLRTDAVANVHGAAALLGILADAHFADRSELDRGDPSAWWDVLRIWSGARRDEVADRYAASVFDTLSRGAERRFSDGSTLAVSATEVRLPAGLASLTQATGDTDYAGATWVPADPSNRSNGRTQAVDRLVITTAQGNVTAAINTFQDSASNRSVHYLVHWDGTITQLVREQDAAWHSACYNQRSVGIMFEGFMDDEDNYTDEQYAAASALSRWILDERTLPRDAETVIGHADVDCGDGVQRFAPGPHFDWDRFLATINGSRMRGEVFYGEDFWTDVFEEGNRLDDALVWLDSGQITLSEGPLGRFSFLVPPGEYVVTAEADGYVPGTRDCTVLPDQDTWCSVMVTEPEDPDPDTGIIAGVVVWGDEGENPFDIIGNHADTRKVVGATVTLEPGTITAITDDDGWYEVEVDPGTYTITAEAAGYEPREAALGPATVANEQIVFRSVMVVRPPAPVPEVTIDAPTAGTVFTEAEITVSGSVSHDEAIDTLTVNGVATTLTGDDFSTTVTLNPGTNLIQVVATDVNARSGSASVTVTYQAPQSGVDGFVWDAELGEGAPIEGAVVTIGPYETTSDHEGWFSTDVPAGAYGLTITAEGYETYSDAVTVAAHSRTDLLVALEPIDDEVGPPPQVTITSPLDGAVVDGPQIWVEGTVSPADPDITVTVNRAAASYDAGTFEAQVTLNPGANAIVVEATDGDGRRGSAAITVTYETTEPEVLGGVDGIVFDAATGPAAPVAGAQVEIGGVQATTNANGVFALEAPVGQRIVTVTATGFEAHAGSVIVREDRRATLEIGLTAEGGEGPEEPDPSAPIIEITFPSDGDVLTTPNVLVTGRTHHASAARVTVNSHDATLGDVDGGFTHEVTLAPGENAIEAVVFNGAGTELGRTLITVTYSGRGSGGCSCASADGPSGTGFALAGLLMLGLAAGRRRRTAA